MKVYVTKYALTVGIIEVESTPNSGLDKDRVLIKLPMHVFPSSYLIGRDCACNIEEAKLLAEKIRVNKIKSLKKQVAKLELLKF